jgi:membrane protease YdiL (CAAX protease family)
MRQRRRPEEPLPPEVQAHDAVQAARHDARQAIAAESAWVQWAPGSDTAVACVTALMMVAIYFVIAHVEPARGVVRFLLMVVVSSLFLTVLFPAYYVLHIRGESLRALGITTRRWWLALLLSIVLALTSFPTLLAQAAQHPGVNLLPHVLFNGLLLWEPFFVHGWLQLRFERAFGVLPGIVLAGVCFGGYHLGMAPWSGVAKIIGIGMVYGGLFRLTRNLLTLFPLTWAVGSGIGTLEANLEYGWDAVAVYAVVLLIQVAALAVLTRTNAA